MIEVVQADITTLAVDAIVNAANAMLRGGGGVDGAIHRAAGPGLMDELRRRYAGCDTGDAVITGGHRLPARFVIHAVGPVWTGSDPEGLLRRTYERAIEVALAEGSIRTIAFPAISTGIYGYPKPAAATVATSVFRAHEGDFDRIVACLFDAESAALYERALGGG